MKTYNGQLTFEVDTFKQYEFIVYFSEDEVKLVEELRKVADTHGLHEATVYFDGISVKEFDASLVDGAVRFDFAILHLQDNGLLRVTGVIKHDRHTFSTGIFKLEDMVDEGFEE